MNTSKIFFSPPAWFLASVLLFLAGCASREAKPESKPGTGIDEYRQLTITAHKAVQSALDGLAQVQAQSNGCPPNVVSNFAAEVRRLQVESVQVRARSQAMQARGDAYFKDWHANLERVKNREVRALAAKNRPQLEQSFGRIKQLSQQGHEAFQPFLAALRQVRNALEKDPASLSTEPVQAVLKDARQHGEQVERCLDGIHRELDSMRALITPVVLSGP